jgi:hypothetical protein
MNNKLINASETLIFTLIQSFLNEIKKIILKKIHKKIIKQQIITDQN